MNPNIISEVPSNLLKWGTKKTFPKGSHIFMTASEITRCYFILSGMVKIYIDHENGRRSILDFIDHDSWIGELSVFCDETDVKENKVLSEVHCLEFDIKELRRYCKDHADISYYFASFISGKLLSRSYRLSEYMNYPLERKLAAFILQYQHNGIYDLPHTDVSEYMNVSYRHVLHVIKSFCDLGILTKNNGYIITDKNKLNEIAKQ